MAATHASSLSTESEIAITFGVISTIIGILTILATVSFRRLGLREQSSENGAPGIPPTGHLFSFNKNASDDCLRFDEFSSGESMGQPSSSGPLSNSLSSHHRGDSQTGGEEQEVPM